MAQTQMALYPCMSTTCSWVTMIPYMRALWSNFCIFVFMLLFSFSIFSDLQSATIENENSSTKTAEISCVGLESLEFR